MSAEALSSVASDLQDPVVRDLVDAIAILAASRNEALFSPVSSGWSILSAAKSHLERRLRTHLTGDGVTDRTWQDRRTL